MSYFASPRDGRRRPFVSAKAIAREASPTPAVQIALAILTSLLAVFVLMAPRLATAQAGPADAAADSAAAAVEEIRALLEQLEGGDAAEVVQTVSDAVPEEELVQQTAGEQPAAAAAAPPPNEVQRAVDQAEAAARRAEAAAAEARDVAKRVAAELAVYRERYARTGPYLGVNVLHAFEDYDTPGFDIDDSYGLAAYAGWRVHRNVAVELRGELYEGFGFENESSPSTLVDGEVDGFAVTLSAKVYPFTGSIQPYAGLGFGVMHAQIEGRRDDDTSVDDSYTDAVIRPAAGLDFFLSENLVLNMEAAYVSPGGDLDGLDFATVGAGLTLRF